MGSNVTKDERNSAVSRYRNNCVGIEIKGAWSGLLWLGLHLHNSAGVSKCKIHTLLSKPVDQKMSEVPLYYTYIVSHPLIIISHNF
jgi:hypothetical protein